MPLNRQLDSCITCLDLEGNDLGGEGAKNLMEALIENCSITELVSAQSSARAGGVVSLNTWTTM